MFNRIKIQRSKLSGISSYDAESIEQKVRRILNNKEPIKDGAPLIYTERKDGVNPAHNIRTDRFEVAVDAMDKVTRSKIAQREGKAKVVDIKTKEDKDAGGESIQATEQ